MRKFIYLSLFLLIFLLSFKSYAQDLVLYYPFDDDGDKVVDKSGKGNNGNYDQGKAIRVAGKDANFGKSAEFDAKSRITVEFNKSLAFDKVYSFVMWVRKKDEAGGIGTLPRIVSRASDLHELAFDSGHLKRGTFAIYFGGNPGWTTCMPVDQEWHHIAVVQDGSAFNVYLDGVSAFQLKNGGPGAFNGNLYIGSRHDLGTKEFFDGYLDEFAIYSGALDANAVKKIMIEGVKGQLMAVSPKSKLSATWGYLKSE